MTWNGLVMKVELVYRPIWNQTTRAVNSHLCVPMVREGEGAPAGGEALTVVGGSPAAVDAALTGVVANTLVAIARRGHNGTIVLPLHYITLRQGAMIGVATALAIRPSARLVHGVAISLCVAINWRQSAQD
ncbi:MAG: hypothetical protein FD153_2036 [Rhodospirillaceae bacterium]|nr:MAG: hypothetical protein FD153_2036 [Rhodospirillaceae bacterium]